MSKIIIITINEKEKMSSSGFYRSDKPPSENKRKQKDKQILGPCLRTKKKLWNIKNDIDTNCSWYVWKCSQRLAKGIGRI